MRFTHRMSKTVSIISEMQQDYSLQNNLMTPLRSIFSGQHLLDVSVTCTGVYSASEANIKEKFKTIKFSSVHKHNHFGPVNSQASPYKLLAGAGRVVVLFPF